MTYSPIRFKASLKLLYDVSHPSIYTAVNIKVVSEHELFDLDIIH